MIRTFLPAIKLATFCIELPRADLGGMSGAMGTGFFVSSDGWFVTAAHVIWDENSPNLGPRKDISKIHLSKPTEFGRPPESCDKLVLRHMDPQLDFALFKADFDHDSRKSWLKGRSGYPWMGISVREMEEGEPVFSFGFPLTETHNLASFPGIAVNPAVSATGTIFSPRVTSAIIASKIHLQGPITTGNNLSRYVIDKALNYGNSGGPIVASETGKVFALCSQFQPVMIPQLHMTDPDGNNPGIFIPSLYGVVTSLASPPIVDVLAKNGVPFSID